jgi:hypothetical protein
MNEAYGQILLTGEDQLQDDQPSNLAECHPMYIEV